MKTMATSLIFITIESYVWLWVVVTRCTFPQEGDTEQHWAKSDSGRVEDEEAKNSFT